MIALPAIASRRISPRWLLAGIVGWLCLDTVLLWRFLALGGALAFLAGLGVAALLTAIAFRRGPTGDGPTVIGLAGCFGVALTLYLLGGEGRLFYSNVDWIVRDAVLRDMAVHPWPFAYAARGEPEILRAPIGMYLVPALAMKAGGQVAGDVALLVQNSALLTMLLGLAAPLFASARARVVALAVVVAFSGMDLIGAMLVDGIPGFLARDHAEWWTVLQFSSHITQAFWAPQHALSGWIGAVCFLLWHDRRLPLGVFLMLVPLTLLWSPLGAMGTVPFAALAVARTLIARDVRVADIACPALACAFVVPTLLYLGAAGETVGIRLQIDRWQSLLVLHLLETLPFAWIALRRAPYRFGRAVPAIAIGTLLAVSAFRIGWSPDLTMRASISALLILSVLLAHRLLEADRAERWVIVGLLAVGSYTGFLELRRAFAWPAAPPPRCSFIRAFDDWGPNPDAAKSNYLAAVRRLPSVIRPARVSVIAAGDPPECLAGPWPKPTGLF